MIKQVKFNGLYLWVLDTTDLNNFRILDHSEIKEFQKADYAQVFSFYHPVTQNEIIQRDYQILQYPFQVLDALRGSISGDYQHDLQILLEAKKACNEEVYQQAYQMQNQP